MVCSRKKDFKGKLLGIFRLFLSGTLRTTRNLSGILWNQVLIRRLVSLLRAVCKISFGGKKLRRKGNYFINDNAPPKSIRGSSIGIIKRYEGIVAAGAVCIFYCLSGTQFNLHFHSLFERWQE